MKTFLISAALVSTAFLSACASDEQNEIPHYSEDALATLSKVNPSEFQRIAKLCLEHGRLGTPMKTASDAQECNIFTRPLTIRWALLSKNAAGSETK